MTILISWISTKCSALQSLHHHLPKYHLVLETSSSDKEGYNDHQGNGHRMKVVLRISSTKLESLMTNSHETLFNLYSPSVQFAKVGLSRLNDGDGGWGPSGRLILITSLYLGLWLGSALTQPPTSFVLWLPRGSLDPACHSL